MNPVLTYNMLHLNFTLILSSKVNPSVRGFVVPLCVPISVYYTFPVSMMRYACHKHVTQFDISHLIAYVYSRVCMLNKAEYNNN
jgi:hypothetical protein